MNSKLKENLFNNVTIGKSKFSQERLFLSTFGNYRNYFVLVILSFVVFRSIETWAEVFQRKVEFEWEAVSGATAYDIEIQKAQGSKPEGKVHSFKTSEATWRGKLAPGDYLIRLRSRDQRGVPGEWSLPNDFKVSLGTLRILAPEDQKEISTTETEKETVTFRWKPVGGANKYILLIKDSLGKDIIKEELTKTEFKMTLPVAQKYHWQVKAMNETGHESEGVSGAEFMITGGSLASPAIEKPENEFVRELKWSKDPNLESIDAKLSRRDPTTKKWNEIAKFENYKENSIPFEEKWEGGQYQFQISGKSPMRRDTQQNKLFFKVRNGNRSPAAEFEALVRKSIERAKGWYVIASYLITQMNYQGKNFETGGASNFRALGGTGRLGAGFMKEESRWGFLGIIDMSGFFYNGTNHTFSSAEANSTYKVKMGRGELRTQLGVYMKDIPDITGDPVTGQVLRESKVSSLGPHLGAEYWYSMSPKLGFQINSHVYYGIQKIYTPNGQAMSPAVSYQVGFLGSYRIGPQFTGLMGYAKRVDRVAYQAETGPSSLADPGEVNTAVVSGDYLNFFAEWDF